MHNLEMAINNRQANQARSPNDEFGIARGADKRRHPLRLPPIDWLYSVAVSAGGMPKLPSTTTARFLSSRSMIRFD
jgi:hypothetical protein